MVAREVRVMQSALARCTRGATAVTYIVVLGLVALVGGIAFGQFEDSVRSGIRQETSAASRANGEGVDGPVGSLAAEVATAGTEQLAVQGAWALAAKAGTHGLASARRRQRGRGALDFEDQRGGGSEADSERSPNAPTEHDPGNASRDPRPASTRDPIIVPPDPERAASTGNSSSNSNASSGSRSAPPNRPDPGPECRGAACGKAQACFAAGTAVLTATGLRPIETIAVGDLVLSADSATGALSQELVLHVFVTEAQPLVRLQVVDPEGTTDVIRTTASHPFWKNGGGWTEASALHTGDVLLGPGGSGISVQSLESLSARETVYNFEVERTHTYFVGWTSAWVHNVCNDPSASGSGQNASGSGQNASGSGQNASGSGQNASNDGRSSSDNGEGPSGAKPSKRDRLKKFFTGWTGTRQSSRVAEKRAAKAPTLPADGDYVASAYYDGNERDNLYSGKASAVRAKIRADLEKQLEDGLPEGHPDPEYERMAREAYQKGQKIGDYVALTQDAQGRPTSAVGRIIGAQNRGNKASPPDPLVGDQHRFVGNEHIDVRNKDDRGHLVPEDGVPDSALPEVNSSRNVVPENALINQQYKQEFENFAKEYAAQHPNQVVFTMHVPHYSGNAKRPDRMTHFLVVDGKIVAEVTFANPEPKTN